MRLYFHVHVLRLPLLLALVACGDDIIEVGPPSVMQIGGTWTYSENLSASAVGVSCNALGTATLTQTGMSFTGSVTITEGVCTDSLGNVFDNTGTQQVTGGQIVNTGVSFQTPFCQYDGTASGSPPNAMSGTETCTVDVSGQSVILSGSWQASR